MDTFLSKTLLSLQILWQKMEAFELHFGKKFGDVNLQAIGLLLWTVKRNYKETHHTAGYTSQWSEMIGWKDIAMNRKDWQVLTVEMKRKAKQQSQMILEATGYKQVKRSLHAPLG